MNKSKKRLSAGMGYDADGIDPLFEFDVPRNFVDLTLPPRYLKVGDHGDTTKLPAHDAWFDHVHDHHSKPTNEEIDSIHQPRESSVHRLHHTNKQDGDVDGEKENIGSGTGTARLKRRNVAYNGKASDTPVSTTKATMRSVSSATGASKKTPLSTAKLPFGNSVGTVSASKTTNNAQTQLSRKRLSKDSAMAPATKPRPSSHRHSAPDATGKDLHDLQALLAKHNKKFKTSHTYEPRQHSVRDVRQWERQSRKSYYKLSSEDRITANAEIAQSVRDRGGSVPA